MATADDALRDRLRANLAAHPRRTAADRGLRRAAVAATVLGDDDGTACFVLTRRAAGLRSHRGQWALPGGRVDPGETAAVAALRELAEEVGLIDVEPLGLLDDYPTRSGYLITPVVCWAAGAPALHPNPDEVAEAYRVPLDALEGPGVPQFRDHPDVDGPVVQLPLVGTVVFAPTAAMLYQLREVAVHGRATRVAELASPPFTWR